MIVLIINLVSTLMLTGIIWFVQIVHYPLFHAVGAKYFRTYEQAHQRLTSYIVVPLMFGELIGAALLPFFGFWGMSMYLAYGNLALAILIWFVTFTVQLPLHRRLAEGYNRQYVSRLVKSNFLRVVLWSGKTVIILIIIYDKVN